MDLGFCFIKFVWRSGNSGSHVHQFVFVGNCYGRYAVQLEWIYDSSKIYMI